VSPPESAALRELARLVHEARPRPREAWAAELDARVADGFGRRRRFRLPALPRPTVLLPAVGTVACLVAAVFIALPLLRGPEDHGESPSTGRATLGVAPAERKSPSPLSEAAPASGGGEASGVRQRKVERSATLALATGAADLDDVADGVVRAADEADGFVASSQVDSTGNGGTARFDLRIPSARLDATLAALSNLAHVRARTESTDDVTGAVVSARERVADAEAERRALLRALGRAHSGTQAEAIRGRLRLVRGAIASSRADVRALHQRTAFSSVSVTVNADGTDEGAGGTFGPDDALHDAPRILGAIAGGLLVALAILLPAALVGGALWAGNRTLRRRARERMLDAA
jgi:hypothetical protein